MSRNEKYPWSLLTEVGDYFCVPTEVKAYAYINQLVAQKNYRLGHELKYASSKTSYGTIVMLVQIGEEIPPHEFVSPEGILASTSRQHLIRSRSQPPSSTLGEKPIVAKRTQGQIIAAMHWEVRNANLPWWYDPQKGTLLVNTKLIQEPESTLWMNKKFNPGAETPYPPKYNLDPDTLLIRDEAEEDDEDYTDDDGEMQLFGTGEDGIDLENDK